MFVLLLTGLLAADPAPPARAKTAALVVRSSQGATWSDGRTTRPLRCYDRLRPGEIVAVGAEGTAVIYFPADGHKEVLHPKSQIVVEAERGRATGRVEGVPSKLKIENRAALQEAITAGKIGGAVVRASDRPEPQIRPVQDAVVVTDQPTLRWPAVEGAEGYRVKLQTAGSRKLVWTREATGTELEYPEDAPPLKRALKYTWSVTALLPNDNEKPHLKDRAFTVGTANMAEQAEAWRELARSDDPADQLLAAVGLEHLGLLDELYPLYVKVTEAVADDPRLWVIQSTWAARAGLVKESEEALQKARDLGWKDEDDSK